MNRRWASGALLIAGGGLLLLLALWLRNPVLPYGGDASAASGAAPSPASNGYEAGVRTRALSSLRAALSGERERLADYAAAALRSPTGTEDAFHFLETLDVVPEAGVIVFEGAAPLAWAGQVSIEPALASAPLSVTTTPFYTVLTATAQRGTRRAIASAVIHAEPPADRFTKSLDDRLNVSSDLQGFAFNSTADTSAAEAVLNVNGLTLLRADAFPLPRDMARFARTSRVRGWGTVILGIGLLVLLGFAWRNRNLLAERLVAIAIALGAISFVPWSSFSNTTRAFDPTYFYSGVGKPLTANSGVMIISASLVLLAVYAIIRARRTRVTPWIGIPVAIGLIVEAVVLAVRMARGIGYPSWGATSALWITWEIPFFLLIFACWLLAVWMLRFALHRRETIRLGAAATVALLAGIAATTIVYRSTIAKRLELASQDISRLQRADNEAPALLRRFGSDLQRYDSAGARPELLKRYATSDLASADLPVSLSTWENTGPRRAELSLAPIEYDSTFVAQLVTAANDSAQPVIAQTVGPNGREIVMAVRHPQNGVTTVVATPRTRLVAFDPFVSLLGFSLPVKTDPPYALTISDVTPNARLGSDSIQWRRIGDEMHGDRLIQTSRGVARAHAEVDLRSIAARGERLVLIVLLNVAIAGFLWALGAIAEGGFPRWVRARTRKWIRSYRGRLTLALSAFFAIPALAFSIWSYQRLRNDDRDVRELLVRETLDAVVSSADSGNAVGTVRRPYNTPLFLYSAGLLTAASDSLLDALSPAGRVLPAPVYVEIASRGELNASSQQDIGRSEVLFGYRAAAGPQQQRYVISAPARSDELTIDRRRRDLTILVLFATVLGALAAIWLSGIAAKVLARDLELSRIEVGRAERILAWGEMARQVAHEIKNPLTPIRLGVQHLRRARTDSRLDFDKVLDENVTRILAEIDRLDEIARSFSRYGAGPSDLPPAEPIDASAILRDVVGLERMGVGDVKWTLSGAEKPILARARSDELRDVLLNVFENARLARARNVDVTIGETANTVTIEIQDNGIGIDQSALPRVFEPQFSTRTTGSGLGLAISRRLLESWGGAIEIASGEGQGTRVTLTLLRAA